MSNDSPSVPKQKLPRPDMPPKSPQLARVVIGSLDDVGLGVEAQYNPKELTIDHSIPWKAPEHIRQGHEHDVEFAGGDGRSLSFELFFDGFESGMSVEKAVQDLTQLARVRDAMSSVDDLRRPHKVAVAWGAGASRNSTDYFPPFFGVIESVQTKYTMFLPGGTPVRATCQIKIKEAADVSFSKPKS
jgi:hypothetical protein